MTGRPAASVRVVVVSHDACELTLACLRSVLATRWPAERLQVTLVDNASTEPVVDRVRSELPDVRVVTNHANVGFGAANNEGLRDRAGVEYCALVNNDATVDPDWLAPLVETLDADSALGAACPKVLLAARYVPVTVRATTRRRGRGDGRPLGVRFTGVRVDGTDVTDQVMVRSGTWGPEPGGEWTRDTAELLVPAQRSGGSCELRLDAEAPTPVSLAAGGPDVSATVGVAPRWVGVPVDGAPVDVINSVGAEWTADGFGRDRGYLETDRGQLDAPADVPAWSGAAVLLRSAYLDAVGEFDERLFLYYEDLDLAWRGAERGWRYRSAPSSVVRHAHSATAVESSSRTRRLNERNRLLVLTRHRGWRPATRAVFRSTLVTASYGRRDVVAPLLRGRRPDGRIVTLRLQALGGYLARVGHYRPPRGD